MPADCCWCGLACSATKALAFPREQRAAQVSRLNSRGPARDVDTFEIAIPAGYVVDDLPPPVDADYSFASYHSKTEVKGNTHQLHAHF